MKYIYTKPEVFESRTELVRSVGKNDGLVFHGTARAIRLINSLSYGTNDNVPNIHREFADNVPKNYFSRN